MTVRTMRLLRTFHRYLGLLFTPAILFFAFSGMLQTFDFHEIRGGVAPPKWIAVIAGIHKKQDFPKPRPNRAPAPAKKPDDATAQRGTAHSSFPLKVFTGLMSIGLMLSSLLGAAIALNVRATRRTAIVMLAAGTLLPIVLLLA